MHEIIYNPALVPEFEGNPLIEALPPILSQADIIRDIRIRPKRLKDVRSQSPQVRIMNAQQILRFHQPLQADMMLATGIDKCLRWGYADRNPMTPEYVRMINERYEAGLGGTLPYRRGFSKTYGFSVLGVSGVGKSTTSELILRRYEPLIRHSSYKGSPLHMNQVVWLKVDCPCDGSPKALCKAVFDEFDHLLGTDYVDRYRRCTLDDLLVRLADAAARENLGILVIDEIQHLCTAKHAVSMKVLNFLVSLVNKIGIPVVLIGTPAAKTILQQDFQQAKRASGQGDITFGSLDGKHSDWTAFLKAMWPYQYTAEEVKQTKDLDDAFFKETFGNQFLMTVLYMLVQEEAILNGKERFDAKSVHEVAGRRLALTKPMREALQKHDDVALKQFLEEKGIFDPWNTCLEQEDEKVPERIPVVGDAAPPKLVDKSSASEKAIRTLVNGFGLTYNDAMSAVNKVVSSLRELPDHTVIARKAYQLYCSWDNSTPELKTQDVKGYENLKEAGMIGGEVP